MRDITMHWREKKRCAFPDCDCYGETCEGFHPGMLCHAEPEDPAIALALALACWMVAAGLLIWAVWPAAAGLGAW